MIFIVLYVILITYSIQFIGNLAYFLLYLIVALGLYIYFTIKTKQTQKESDINIDKKYKQLEILTSLYSALEIKTALPETGGWAASPDLLKKITETIFHIRPKIIVEASSGVSSIIAGYCLKKIGGGKVISLEHDILYVEKSRALIRKHNLEAFVKIIHAPLIEHQINNEKWIWYDISSLEDVPPIDIVVVDGPPYYVQELSRYPVIPLLYDKMSDNSILLLDDGVRDEEKAMTEMWKKEFEHISIEYYNFEFGAFVLNKKVADNSKRALLAFTTANQLAYNIKGINSILKNKPVNVDIVVFDDASNDGTIEWCRDNNITIVTKESAKGLTNSWNLAYQLFKEEGYKHLIFSNSDIVVPKHALDNLLSQNEKFIIVSPLSTKKGAGHQPLQDVRSYHKFIENEYDFLNTQIIQDSISLNSKAGSTKTVNYINGFFFAVNRDVINYEYSDNELFNPENHNVGNENELCEKVTQPIAIVIDSYVFHFKGVSIEVTNMDHQNYELNIYRNLNWQDAERLKNSALRKLWFKIKYKIGASIKMI
mgnify:CR=1 FL=1